MEAADYFSGHPLALALHQEIATAISRIGPVRTRVSKSQVGFYREHPFAATWRASQHLGRELAPLVLSIYLQRRDTSPRWKEVVEPSPGRFTHHLELRSVAEVDEFVRARLTEAWEQAA